MERINIERDDFHGEWNYTICLRNDLADAVNAYKPLAHFAGRVARWCVPDDVVFALGLPVQQTTVDRKSALAQRPHAIALFTAGFGSRNHTCARRGKT